MASAGAHSVAGSLSPGQPFDPSELLDEFPFVPDNRAWLKNQPKNQERHWYNPHKCWELPPSSFNELIALILTRFGSIYIFQPCREREACAPPPTGTPKASNANVPVWAPTTANDMEADGSPYRRLLRFGMGRRSWGAGC